MGAINLLRGSVRVCIKCRYPERAVNICAARHIDFRDMVRNEDGVTLTVSSSGYRKLCKASNDSGAFSVTAIKKSGMPFLLVRVKKRIFLLMGAVLCVMLVWVSSFFIWQIDVTGNDTVSSAEILAELRELGVYIGASTFSVSQPTISNEMLLRFPELCWITLNTHGSRIEVIVRETVPRPEIRNPDVPAMIVASKAGIITDMLVLNGEQTVAVGDAVDTGDILVSAVVNGTGLVHAEAEVWASTRCENTLSMPLSLKTKSYTGDSRTRFSVVIGGKRILLYPSGIVPFERYDKTISSDTWSVFGSPMPITVIKEVYTEYEADNCVLNVDSAIAILKAELLATLEDELGSGYAVDTQFVASNDNGVLTVTMYAECVEKISVEAEVGEQQFNVNTETPLD